MFFNGNNVLSSGLKVHDAEEILKKWWGWSSINTD